MIKLSKKKELENALQNYLLYCYKNNIYINSILGNKQSTILDIYQPLEIEHFNEKYKINGSNIDFLKKYKNVLIVDAAGMGKSTLTKYLSIQTLLDGNVIPIIIELRNLQGYEIIEYIRKQIKSLYKDILTSDVKEILSVGGFLIIFDGFDEIEDRYQKTISYRIREFVNKSENNYFILTSREMDGLFTFGNFTRFGIKKLTLDESIELLKKIDSCGELSLHIIEKLENDYNYNNVKGLLENPLLVSLLYKTFEYGSVEIPCKKSDFYNQIFYALYEKHDLTKDANYMHVKKSKLGISDFYSVLRRIAFKCLQEQKIEYSRDGIVKIIDASIDEMKWIKADKDGMLKDLIFAVPFFQDLNIHVKWVHKSFMEFFAASFICMDTPDKEYILELLCEKPARYYNVLDFCYDLDSKAFRINILYPLLETFLKDYFEDYSKLEDISLEDFNLRKSMMCIYDAIIVNYKAELEEMYNSDVDIDKLTVKEKCEAICKRLNLSGVEIRETRNCMLIVKDLHRNYILFELFKEKGIDIFEIKKKYTKVKYCDFEFTTSNFYELKKASNNQVNSKNNFILANIMMIENKKVMNLNYDKCRKMFDEISKEIKEDNGIQTYNL